MASVVKPCSEARGLRGGKVRLDAALEVRDRVGLQRRVTRFVIKEAREAHGLVSSVCPHP